mgnify:FL=1
MIHKAITYIWRTILMLVIMALSLTGTICTIAVIAGTDITPGIRFYALIVTLSCIWAVCYLIECFIEDLRDYE